MKKILQMFWKIKNKCFDNNIGKQTEGRGEAMTFEAQGKNIISIRGIWVWINPQSRKVRRAIQKVL